MQLALRTARTFWLKKTVKWSAVRPAPDGIVRGLPPGVTACPDLSGGFAKATIKKQHHSPASHHECKNTPTFTAFGTGHCAPPRLCANCTYRRTVSCKLAPWEILNPCKKIDTIVWTPNYPLKY